MTDDHALEVLRTRAEPLPEIDSDGFAEVFDRYADARVVLLGEASHGTSEFYLARAAITRRLVERHGFSVVALEADWPDAAHLDRFVRHRQRRQGEETAFQRFPSWMWRNAEFDSLVRWLHEHNRQLEDEQMAGLYGLDLYNLHGSMQAVIGFLEERDPALAAEARQRYSCLAPFSRDPARYGALALSSGYAFCADGAVAMLTDLLKRECLGGDCDEWLDAAANARLVKNAEAYYRAMFHGSEESWNLRDTHMFETLCQLLEAKPGAKAVVWAHNSHIGDARATDMGRSRGELNIGQQAKQKFGDEARLIGFGTHAGTVAAADDWDEPMEVKQVRPSLPGSQERLCHDSGIERFLLDLRELSAGPLDEPRLERFIGVIYRPQTERWSHYSEAVLSQQFDGWVWFDETTAVTPLSDVHGEAEAEMWPFGL
ncbi:erythromycin esterase family protein [Sphingomonas sp. GCM10030256]|uniref:erythromycin esterase family protein n=1 Tax=Sphingomonas sp. GCM10030256 TaxID=3273427 RepID=UPI00361C42EA